MARPAKVMPAGTSKSDRWKEWYARPGNADSKRKYTHDRRSAQTPESRRADRWRYYLKERYDITPGQYDQMIVDQDGKCAACGGVLSPIKRFDNESPAVDHDHITGRVRGILHHGCNTAEGLLLTPARARALAAYMEQHSQSTPTA